MAAEGKERTVVLIEHVDAVPFEIAEIRPSTLQIGGRDERDANRPFLVGRRRHGRPRGQGDVPARDLRGATARFDDGARLRAR